MRTLPDRILTLLILMLFAGSAVQAQTVDAGNTWSTAQLAELHFFFQHLANLDAAADAKEAADSTFDASSWRTLEQRAAGLTDFEGTVVKEAASACLQALDDHNAEVQAAAATGAVVLTDGRQIVASALDELRLQLGEERFQALAAYVHATFGSELEVVSTPPGPGAATVEDPSATAVPPIFEIFVGGRVTKLSGPSVLAECFTNLIDDAVRQSYPTGVTGCQLFSNGLPPENVSCNGTGQCVDVLGALPGLQRWTQGVHAVGMYQGQCTPPDAPPFPGLLDPLRFCRAIPEFRSPSGSVFNLGGEAACWPFNSAGNCIIARSVSNLVTFIDINPLVVHLGQGEQQAFFPIIPAVLNLFGPGILQGNVYTAPATLSGPQTASIRACDAAQPLDDCISATIFLEPLKVEVTPESLEALPEQEIKLTAAVAPQGRQVEWTLSLPASDPPGSPAGAITASEDTLTGTYKAPNNNDITFVADVTVKACMKPAPPGGAVCDTARVLVPKIQFFISGATHDLRPGQTVQLTATYQGSSLTRKVKWERPFAGTLAPVDSTQTLDDTLVVLYTAPSGDQPPIDVKACFQESPSFCATWRINFVPGSAVYSVTPDNGAWLAGTITPFTITGLGFGTDPTRVSVTFGGGIEGVGGVPATVTSVTNTKLQGVVRLLVSLGGKTLTPTRVSFPTPGDYIDTFQPPVAVVAASLSVSPTTPPDLHAGESYQFSALCLAAGAPCTSGEIPTWTASPGQIDGNGRYTAPATVTANTTATITACWGTGYCANRNVNLVAVTGPVVSVEPETATVFTGQTQPFTAQVTGTTNTAVNWSIEPSTPEAGSINQSGLYSAPATLGDVTTVTVIATSQADTNRSDTATVTLARQPVTLTCTPSPAFATFGQAINWTATATGLVPATTQYALFRKKVGDPEWTPPVATPSWQPGNVLSWTPAADQLGTWEIIVWVKDGNTPATENGYGFAGYCNPGPVQVVGHPTVTSTPSPANVYHGTTVNWTATGSGGVPGTLQYALFRKKSGDAEWTPPVATPSWQTGNELSWTPGAGEVGTWEIIVWVKDAHTPADMNGYGFAGYANPGPVRVVAPPTVTSTPSPAYANHNSAIDWTATGSGGVPGTLQYALFRRKVGSGPDWTPPVTSPAWQPGNTLSWTPSSSENGTWEIVIWVRDSLTPPDMNGYGFAGYTNAGPVQVVTPLAITCSISPSSGGPGTGFTVIATPSGGVPGTFQYAFFRRRAGTTPWTPDVTAPGWQAANSSTWTPLSADVGTWENYVWAKDATTKPGTNTYGYSAGCNPGPISVLAPLTVTSTASPSWVNHGTTLTWTATASGGTPASTQYALVRRPSGTTAAAWTPAESSPAWQTSNVLAWTPGPADVGTWEFSIRVRDGNTPATMNTYGYAASYNPGNVQVVAPLTLTVTPTPPAVYYGNPVTWTATAGGGTGVSRQYAFFRRRAGAASWTPAVTSPAWQTGNTFTWTPTSADAGTWEAYVWVKDSATPAGMNAYGYAAGYNPGAVQVVAPPVVSGTGSPTYATYGNTLSWTASVSGGITPTTYQYAFFRRKVGTTSWIPAVTAPAWQAGNVMTWTPGAADVGTWETSIWIKDGYTPATMKGYGYAAYYNPGPVQVVAPLTVTGTGSPAYATYGNTLSWTATASGGVAGTIQYALFRKKVGTTSWIPAVTSPAWQAGNVMSWTPGAADVGTWEIVVWVKDANTPASMNGYGYAAYYNAGPVQVVAPLTVSGTGSPASVSYGTAVSWTAYANGGVAGTIQYAFFRKKVGTASWIPAVTAPAWQAGNVMSWTPGAADVGTWETSIWVRDANTPAGMNGYGFAAYYNPGPLEVVGPLSVTCSGSPASAPYGTALNWTAYASGGYAPTIQYAFFRRRVGTSSWVPAVTSPAWQASNVMSWTSSSGDVGTWETYIWVRDANTPAGMNGYGYAAGCNPGPVAITAPLGVYGTGSPGSSPYGNTITWTAYATGGYPPTTRYALFRRLAGTASWIPAVTSPAWQASNVLSWTPTAGDVGTWEIVIWVRDGNTPANMNGYGYAAYYNAGPVEVTEPIWQYYPPSGWIDGFDGLHVWGWACDPDYPWESNRVDFWTTGWQFLGSADANGWSSSGIYNACGGGWAHYFDFYHWGGILPGTHFMGWSIDLPYATPGNDNRPIGGFGSTGDGTEFVMP